MIDPAHALAFSMQANPGTYAMLLGSGVSRSAQIPTGWEITLDLIRKLAELEGESCEPDPEKWYADKYGGEADYSDLLKALAPTPTERQSLLRSYIEPDPQAHDKPERQPTPAHHAIADLAAGKFIKLIITTNFDRLMETALVDAGVQPTIISSPNQMQGALPLIHTQCCLFKIHGDYRDPRILNTPEELAKYPEEYNQFLDRVLDEFGLIICGWSAEWDIALRNAISHARARRFTMYWVLRGEPGDEARRLIEHSRAEKISVEDANTFCSRLQESVRSLERFSRPHPLSATLAVANLKLHIEEKNLIRLTDLINETVSQILEITSDKSFSLAYREIPTTKSATEHVRAYEKACSTLLALAFTGGFWVEEEHYGIWQKSLQRLSQVKIERGDPLWMGLRRYPGTLLLYALGMGALESERLSFLGHILKTEIARKDQQPILAVQTLPPSFLFGRSGGKTARILEGMERSDTPLNDWLHETLRQYMKPIIREDERYTLIFDKFEILMTLVHGCCTGRKYWLLGTFVYRRHGHQKRYIFTEIADLLRNQSLDTSGIFGSENDPSTQVLDELKCEVSDPETRYHWFRED